MMSWSFKKFKTITNNNLDDDDGDYNNYDNYYNYVSFSSFFYEILLQAVQYPKAFSFQFEQDLKINIKLVRR